MQVYLFDIYLSLLFFPLIAGLLTLPYLVYQYRKHDAIPWQKTVLFFVFVLYLICAYFLVIMPLPADRTAVTPYAETPQLVPFNFIAEIISEAGSSSFIDVVLSPAVYEALFNMVLLLPLGIILKYYLKRTWWQALLIGFSVTLFFELSQLTGLFGIYEHPYRLFDVDDLILNTFGAMLGFWIAIPATKILPNLDSVTNRKAMHELRASLPRRLAALLLDLLLVAVCDILLIFVFGGIAYLQGAHTSVLGNPVINICCSVLVYILVFVMIPSITKGQTLGQKAVRIRLVKVDGATPRWYAYAANYGLFFLIIYTPFWLSEWLVTTEASATRDLEPLLTFIQSNLSMLSLAWGVLALAWFATFVIRAYRSKKLDTSLILFSEWISNTRTIAQNTPKEKTDLTKTYGS